MASLPTKLASATWLMAPGVRAVFAALDRDGDSARVVGGAVRNALVGLPVGDIDFATTATPDLVTRRAEAAGFKVVPTGFEHGTVTLVRDGKSYEVTTLRHDVETYGRHAVVAFGRDWAADAARRDFTLNALYVDSAGTLYDPVDGYPDLVARRIRFIGDAGQRIAEDRLRILRFFRFHAAYGTGALDPAGLSAAIRARNTVRDLSGERVGQEMRRLLVAPRAVETIFAMQDGGILPVILGGVGYVVRFARMAAFEQATGSDPAFAPQLTALAVAVEEDIARLTGRLRLANAERERMADALAAQRALTPLPDERNTRRLLYRMGAQAYRDGLAQVAGRGGEEAFARLRAAHGLPDRWTVPVFPLGGRDVLEEGAPRGPAVGEVLRAIEALWIAGDFREEADALRIRLQQMLASVQ